ncbi:MAG: 3-isopropylmalate dehydratase small subunit [Myxococcota bacterium]
MTPLRTLRSAVIVIPVDDVDTDQIIPARFLTTTVKQGLGRHLFHDWRYDASGQPRMSSVLDQPQAAGRQVLLAGRNFGCGSSREHAPWALVDWGLRAVIAPSFADIFRSNALKNGLLPVALPPPSYEDLRARLEAEPATEVEIDVAERRLYVDGGPTFEFPLDSFSRRCLLDGLDEIGVLLSHANAITAYEQDRQIPPPPTH